MPRKKLLRGIAQKKYQGYFEKIYSKIPADDFEAMKAEINSIFDPINNGEHRVSIFFPENHREGTVWEPLDKACNGEKMTFSMFFLFLVYLTIMDRTSDWRFFLGEDDRDIIGKSFFRKK